MIGAFWNILKTTVLEGKVWGKIIKSMPKTPKQYWKFLKEKGKKLSENVDEGLQAAISKTEEVETGKMEEDSRKAENTRKTRSASLMSEIGASKENAISSLESGLDKATADLNKDSRVDKKLLKESEALSSLNVRTKQVSEITPDGDSRIEIKLPSTGVTFSKEESGFQKLSDAITAQNEALASGISKGLGTVQAVSSRQNVALSTSIVQVVRNQDNLGNVVNDVIPTLKESGRVTSHLASDMDEALNTKLEKLINANNRASKSVGESVITNAGDNHEKLVSKLDGDTEATHELIKESQQHAAEVQASNFKLNQDTTERVSEKLSIMNKATNLMKDNQSFSKMFRGLMNGAAKKLGGVVGTVWGILKRIIGPLVEPFIEPVKKGITMVMNFLKPPLKAIGKVLRKVGQFFGLIKNEEDRQTLTVEGATHSKESFEKAEKALSEAKTPEEKKAAADKLNLLKREQALYQVESLRNLTEEEQQRRFGEGDGKKDWQKNYKAALRSAEGNFEDEETDRQFRYRFSGKDPKTKEEFNRNNNKNKLRNMPADTFLLYDQVDYFDDVSLQEISDKYKDKKVSDLTKEDLEEVAARAMGMDGTEIGKSKKYRSRILRHAGKDSGVEVALKAGSGAGKGSSLTTKSAALNEGPIAEQVGENVKQLKLAAEAPGVATEPKFNSDGSVRADSITTVSDTPDNTFIKTNNWKEGDPEPYINKDDIPPGGVTINNINLSTSAPVLKVGAADFDTEV